MGVIRSHTYKFTDGAGYEIQFPKKSYDSEKEAIAAANRINAYGNDIHKMVAYKCSKCDKWHVGHNYTVMTDERREEAKEKIKKENG